MKRKIRRYSQGGTRPNPHTVSGTSKETVGKISQEGRQALQDQRKGAREAISPSTKTGNRVVSTVMNAVVPFSGTAFNKYIDNRAMGYGKTKKKSVMPPPPNNNKGSDSVITPIVANKPIDPLLINPKDNFFNFKAYNVGGLSGGVRYGPPPKRGPNPQVPPVKLYKGSKKEIKAGYHKMPDGSIMKNSAHKGRKK